MPVELPALLNATLKHVKVTCVLGPTNRLDNLAKTASWTRFLESHSYYPGTWYRKSEAGKWFLSEQIIDKDYEWQYAPLGVDVLDFKFVPRLLCAAPLDPLKDKSFALNSSVKQILADALLTTNFRFGNCLQQSEVAFDYLWQNSAGVISRIELIGMQRLDHGFLLINRREGSDKNAPATWGDDCYILDPWVKGEGCVRKAKDFLSFIDEAKADCLAQVPEAEVDEKNFHYRFDILTDINPKKMPYPVYSPHHRLSDYYECEPLYIAVPRFKGLSARSIYKDLQALHRRDFNGVLRSLNKHRFFQKTPSSDDAVGPKKTGPSKPLMTSAV